MAAMLAVLTVLALLGSMSSVSCQDGSNGGGYYSTPPPPACPPPSPPPPTYSPPAPQPPPPTYPSPPPPPLYPPPSPQPQPPTYPPPTPQPQPPAYPPVTPPPPSSPPPSPPPPPSYPPTTPPPPPPTYPPATPPPPAYPPSPSPSPSPSTPPPSPGGPGNQLKIGYYNGKCKRYLDVEATIRRHVAAADAGMKAGLIRMHFHDCFVRGCDASVLLDATPANPQPEMLGIPNNPSLRGYEVIDSAKAELEARCGPGIVSCADIVAFAARDAAILLSNGRVNYGVPAGRYDGTVSLANETLPNLPPPFAQLPQLEQMFAAKGLGVADMVTLSGAHTVGRSHCSSFNGRIPPGASDMDPGLAANLRAACASSNGTDNVVPQDFKSPDFLDVLYYRSALEHKVLFNSDAALMNATDTATLVKTYAWNARLWEKEFGDAMVRMGRVEVKTAADGEIRKNCRVVNS